MYSGILFKKFNTQRNSTLKKIKHKMYFQLLHAIKIFYEPVHFIFVS